MSVTMTPTDEKTVSARGDQRFVIECGDFVSPPWAFQPVFRREATSVLGAL
jgi:hypothetical protein